MSEAVTISLLPARPWGSLRRLLELIGELRAIGEPLTEPDGLRGAVELMLKLAELIGLDEAWRARLRQILDDPATFALVLAIVQYVSGRVMGAEGRTDGLAADEARVLTVDARGFVEWLPVILELLELLRRLRGER